MKRVLTIAGSDSGGGAGIQADLKTFAALEVYGMSAITAITAQNTVGVQGVFALPESFIVQQITSVIDDIGVDAIKIGMLANKDIIASVATILRKYNISKVVVDPVMVAKSGDSLLDKDAESSLIEKLFPLSFVVTPNLHEAKLISGIDIATVDDIKKAAHIIHRMGAKHAVVKGGNTLKSGYALDILYDGKSFYEFKEKYIETNNIHGTGCRFAAAITAELAKGQDIYQAVKKAKIFLSNALKASQHTHLGHGHGPLIP